MRRRDGFPLDLLRPATKHAVANKNRGGVRRASFGVGERTGEELATTAGGGLMRYCVSPPLLGRCLPQLAAAAPRDDDETADGLRVGDRGVPAAVALRDVAYGALAGIQDDVTGGAELGELGHAVDGLAADDLVGPPPIGGDGDAAGSVRAPRGSRHQQGNRYSHSGSIRYRTDVRKMRGCAVEV